MNDLRLEADPVSISSVRWLAASLQGKAKTGTDCREGGSVYTGPMPGAKMEIPVKLNILDKSEEV